MVLYGWQGPHGTFYLKMSLYSKQFLTEAIEAEEADGEEAFVSDFSNVNVRSRSGKV